ncbi:hypothetical protein M378DRAFT_172027 [Amanita muscaria Koide BX008]|uniref:Uncharacterized protein n=1 Tax=Amanita muscaria (strain Koide BX008) TaxID=946122 RepID=A0A0C2S3H1_AMAMK|nr:hypothetical protein M378DRAFT_172027 [Amanita muscaria Koide BX008]
MNWLRIRNLNSFPELSYQSRRFLEARSVGCEAILMTPHATLKFDKIVRPFTDSKRSIPIIVRALLPYFHQKELSMYSTSPQYVAATIPDTEL